MDNIKVDTSTIGDKSKSTFTKVKPKVGDKTKISDKSKGISSKPFVTSKAPFTTNR
jgi:hypothetical protein